MLSDGAGPGLADAALLLQSDGGMHRRVASTCRCSVLWICDVESRAPVRKDPNEAGKRSSVVTR